MSAEYSVRLLYTTRIAIFVINICKRILWLKIVALSFFNPEIQRLTTRILGLHCNPWMSHTHRQRQLFFAQCFVALLNLGIESHEQSVCSKVIRPHQYRLHAVPHVHMHECAIEKGGVTIYVYTVLELQGARPPLFYSRSSFDSELN